MDAISLADTAPENDDVNDISVKSSKKMFTWLPINPNWTRRTGQEDNP